MVVGLFSDPFAPEQNCPVRTLTLCGIIAVLPLEREQSRPRQNTHFACALWIVNFAHASPHIINKIPTRAKMALRICLFYAPSIRFISFSIRMISLILIWVFPHSCFEDLVSSCHPISQNRPQNRFRTKKEKKKKSNKSKEILHLRKSKSDI